MGKSKSIVTQIPRWKYWLSYIYEINLETTGSEHNPELTICLDRGRLQLYTENAIYSFEDLYDNFTNAFSKLDFNKKEFKSILILGFGLGSVPYMLEKKFGVKAHYTGVEIDEEIIRLAGDYALPKLNAQCTLITADAHTYVTLTEEKFDMIVVDVFLDNIIPARFETLEFLKNIKEMLNEGGLLLYNRLTATEYDKEKHKEFYESCFNPIFRESIEIEVEDNTILLNTPIYLASKS